MGYLSDGECGVDVWWCTLGGEDVYLPPKILSSHCTAEAPSRNLNFAYVFKKLALFSDKNFER